MMTPIQKKVFHFIQEFIAENGYAPLLKEIALGIGISPKSKSFISRTVHELAEAGLLVVDEQRRPRNMQLIGAPALTLPLLGRIAAGMPIEAVTQLETLDLSSLLVKGNHYVLEVKGDSMIEEGILDGDNIICRQQTTANEGEIIVALIDDQEATLKRISYKPKDKITLLPANPQLKAQEYDIWRVKVQGLFIGLLRFNKKV